MPRKIRLDQLVFDLGLAKSRERAKRLVMTGRVFLVQGDQKTRLDKPGTQVPPDARLFVKDKERFVSRGGHKLLTAIEHFKISVAGKTALDVGASTGGFTDCLLQHGAEMVYAVDVGHGLLDSTLRDNERVVVLERVNMRHAPKDLLPELVDVVTVDVSFISLAKVLPPCLRFLRPGGELVALVKPQFELGPGSTRKGVVREPKLQRQAVDQVVDFAVSGLGLSLVGSVPSKIKGPKGNQEYLAYFKNPS
ncbi:MAG: TlyA family RNA methyltransferase [Thermodesulfobacteriota bacterium]|nr:TlyA family RNA methyltransferase [Thermodesulfobacteriota bacterium]